MYAGARFALLTQHGKEQAIAPILEFELNCRVELVTGYDTDLLGTFTREIPRAGTQLEAARKKARTAMELSGLDFGLASEGSFGPDPFMGVMPWNVEMVILIDAVRGLEFVGAAQGRANFAHLSTADIAAATSFARESGFPEHHLVIRPASENDPRIRKGIRVWIDFEHAFFEAREQAANGLVFIETDVRAHANPTRMNNIRSATSDLAARLSSLCPVCGSPGFWVTKRLPGLPCAECGSPTREIRVEIHACPSCAHQVTREPTERRSADPGSCDICNP